MNRAKVVGLVLVLGAGFVMSACSTPSERYGLAPPEANSAPYPNINVDPTVKSAEASLTPEQRAAAEAELQRQAGKRPKVQAPAPR